MSLETMQSSCDTSVSYRFVLKLLLKGKDLMNLSNDTEKTSIIRSDMYVFKAAKNLRFYLEIVNNQFRKEIQLVGSKMWSFELLYAFLVSKGRAFHLKASNGLWFLSSWSSHIILDEDIPVHCAVVADPVLLTASTEENDFSTKEDGLSAKEDELALEDGQIMVDIQGRPNIAFPTEGYSNKVVTDFIRRGYIPNFNIPMAIQILREMEQHKCEVLKILSMQYLERHITSQNIREISRAAIDCGLPALERACVEKIANGIIRTK